MYVLRQKVAAGDFPRVVLVHMAQAEEAEPFFQKRWPEAIAIADPQAELYRAFGLRRGSWGQLLGFQALWAGLRGLLAGHGVGRPKGDPLMLSGRFLIVNHQVHWEHRHEHSVS